MFKLKSMRLFPILSLTVLAACGNLSAALLDSPNNNMSSKTEANSPPAGFSQEEINKLSEAFGHFIGRNLNNPGVHFDLESIIRGIRNGYAGSPAPMSEQEYEKMMTRLQEQAFQQLSQENLKAANAFLEKNKNAGGIIEIEPGKLQYLILQKGTGSEVKPNGTPQINYVGKYIDGTVFGNSEEVGGPITIPLGQTIKGFSQGIANMKEGEKRRLFIHPDLGYGTTGQLPPNALLIFDIEVVKAETPNTQSHPLSGLEKAGVNHKDLLDKYSQGVGSSDDDDDDNDDDDNDDDDSDDDDNDSLKKGLNRLPPSASKPASK